VICENRKLRGHFFEVASHPHQPTQPQPNPTQPNTNTRKKTPIKNNPNPTQPNQYKHMKTKTTPKKNNPNKNTQAAKQTHPTSIMLVGKKNSKSCISGKTFNSTSEDIAKILQVQT
jgi:hypothetical protein